MDEDSILAISLGSFLLIFGIVIFLLSFTKIEESERLLNTV
jgi:hypothetical protein